VLSPVQRKVLGEVLVGDHDARGVCRRVACQAFDDAGVVEELPHAVVPLVQVTHLGFLVYRPFDAPVRGGDELGYLVDLRVGHAERTPHVAHRRLGLHGPEGGDLGDVVLAVLVGDVFDDPVASLAAEVDVDVGHADAFRVQEALEDEVVLDGVDVRDAEAERDEAARRGAAARPHGYAMGLRVVDEIGDDEEVPGEPRLLDDAHLVVEPLAVLVEKLFAEGIVGGPHFGHSLLETLPR